METRGQVGRFAAPHVARALRADHLDGNLEPECTVDAAPVLDPRKQVADFERSLKPMEDVLPMGQLICMALRYTSDQKGYPQPSLQSL